MIRRRLACLVTALALTCAAVPTVAGAQDGAGGKNVVLVNNQTDGRVAGRAGVLTGHAASPSVVPENLAVAKSSCTDCRTVAVALQAVVVTAADPDVIAPHNVASAANGGCENCWTLAYAWQYVVGFGGSVRITEEGHARISDIRARASSLADSDLAFPVLIERLDGLAAEFRSVMNSEVERVGGGPGKTGRSVKTDTPC